jgi:hypothetical protein
MFPKEHLYLLLRDEDSYHAELALWEQAFTAGSPAETAVLIGMAACFSPKVLLEEAEAWLAEKPAWPATAYASICWRIAEIYASAAREILNRSGHPIDYLDWAEKIACYSAQSAWLRDLAREVRKALVRKWEKEVPPLPKPTIDDSVSAEA